METPEKENGTLQPESSEPQNHAREQKEREMEQTMPDPPDGGWGWVVVFSSFMIHAIVDGVTYIFGIYYMEFLREFGESKGATSWIASIMVCTTFCVGPFASGLIKQFGWRTVTIIGSIVAAIGLIISTIAPNITFLFFSIGICTGVGFGLMYFASIVSVTWYFEKKRAFATGIAVCGSGIGTFALAPLTEWMVSILDWQGAMLITGGLVLNCCVFGALSRPLESKKPVRRLKTCSREPINGDLKLGSLDYGKIGCSDKLCCVSLQVENLKKHSSLLGRDNHTQYVSVTFSCSPTSSQRSSIQRRSQPHAAEDVPDGKNVHNMVLCVSCLDKNKIRVPNDIKKPAKTSATTNIINCLWPVTMRRAFDEMMNFRLMSNIIFLIFGVSNFCGGIGFYIPFVYTKDRAVGLGLAEEDSASFLVSIMGISNIMGRVVLGYYSDHSRINRLWLYIASGLIGGFATIFSSFCSSYNLMALYSAIFGITTGTTVSLQSVILVDLLGLEKLTNAFGLLMFFAGIAGLIGSPITGWLYDYTGSYDPGFYVSGGIVIFSRLLLFFIPCVQRSTVKEKESEQTEIQFST